MSTTPMTKIREEFEKQFTELRFGDGSPNGGGKGAYRVIKENTSLNEITDWWINRFQQELEKIERENDKRGGYSTSDIIEKSDKLSSDWLEKEIKKNLQHKEG